MFKYHMISSVYAVLESSHVQQDTRAKLKWEEELNICISEECWKGRIVTFIQLQYLLTVENMH